MEKASGFKFQEGVENGGNIPPKADQQISIYHLERIDGPTPMYWFIMAPYNSPPNLGVAIAIYHGKLRYPPQGQPPPKK